MNEPEELDAVYVRYMCAICGHGGAHEKHRPAPFCSECKAPVKMRPFNEVTMKPHIRLYTMHRTIQQPYHRPVDVIVYTAEVFRSRKSESSIHVTPVYIKLRDVVEHAIHWYKLARHDIQSANDTYNQRILR